MTGPDLPFPPTELRERVFAAGEDPDSTRVYARVGADVATVVESTLPTDWTWSGARVLDFACGAGRVARHLAARHPDAEIVGCDVHTPSVEWLQTHPAIGVTAVACDPDPPLRFPDHHFDLVYGISAFTHIAWNWDAWIAEMHRILRPGGLLLATLLGSSLRPQFFDGEYDDDDFGLMAVANWNPAHLGGPVVTQSAWWLREHWGRAFDPLSHVDDAFVVGLMADGTPHRQSTWLGRARAGHFDAQALAALAPDPRETVGLAAAQRLLAAEFAHLAAAVPAQATPVAPPRSSTPPLLVRVGRAAGRRIRDR